MENKIFDYIDIRTVKGYYRFADSSLKEAIEIIGKSESEPKIIAIHCYS